MRLDGGSKGSWKDFINMDNTRSCVCTDGKETKESKMLKTQENKEIIDRTMSLKQQESA